MNDHVEALAEALWSQSWNHCMGPLPKAGHVRERFLDRACLLAAAYEASKIDAEPIGLRRGNS